MNITKTACDIKRLLVQMAIDDKLPMDMNDLSTEGIEKILKRNSKVSKYDKAADLLSADGDKEVKRMVKLIEKAKPDILIDYIEGVEVCEKFEHTFTVKSFLEQIN